MTRPEPDYIAHELTLRGIALLAILAIVLMLTACATPPRPQDQGPCNPKTKVCTLTEDELIKLLSKSFLDGANFGYAEAKKTPVIRRAPSLES
jgi:hypothetical protein